MSQRSRSLGFSWLLLAPLALAAPLACMGCASEDVVSDEEGGTDENLTVSAAADRLLDIPMYFAVSTDSLNGALPRQQYPYPTVWNKTSSEGFSGDVGLRMIVVNGTSAKVKGDAAGRLMRAGALQEGDIVLSFRPNLAATMSYPHIQMGSTHAGLIVSEGEGATKTALNVDSPLNAEYNADKNDPTKWSRLSAVHYAGAGNDPLGTEALHVIRPRNFTAAQKAQLLGWFGKIRPDMPNLYKQIPFNGDYLAPSYATGQRTIKQNVTALGKILLRKDTTSKIGMYCSELAWHLLSLANCTESQIENAPAEGAACVQEPFKPMAILGGNEYIGLGDGPVVNIKRAAADKQAGLLASVFPESPNAVRLSPGHLAVSQLLDQNGMMKATKQYYGAKLAGQNDVAGQIAAGVNNGVPTNYSPTAFLVNTMLPKNDPNRKFDYVATIVFTNTRAAYDKAVKLSKNPVP